MSRVQVKADRKDYLRALLTDVTPYEMPIITCGVGLYEHAKKLENDSFEFYDIVDKILGFKKRTKPYKYKVNKEGGGLRELFLVHPASQVAYAKFLKEYDNIIAYYCRRSKTSIRSPTKVGDIYYVDSPVFLPDKYRDNSILISGEELYKKYAISYFSYRGYTRLHKFWNSFELLKLEKRYRYLLMIDVSAFFSSIYTHSLSWSTHGKEFSKDLNRASYFSGDFDRLMQNSNHGETNGIPVGPEISRVFAEVLMEGVDKAVVRRLERQSLKLGVDYVIRRYVDDFYIFCNDEGARDEIEGHYIDELMNYNLFVNESKTNRMERPFLTSRSSAMKSLSDLLNDFFVKIMTQKNDGGLAPVYVRYRHRLYVDFVDRVKSILAKADLGYEVASSYIISAIFRRSALLIEDFNDECGGREGALYLRCFDVFSQIVFYFYSVFPLVGSSFDLLKFVVLVSRFFKREFPDFSEMIFQRMYEGGVAFLKSPEVASPSYVDNHVSLEKINVLIALRELGDEYLLPSDFICSQVIGDRNLGYYEIISLLFYIGGRDEYAVISEKIMVRLERLKLHMSRIIDDSESIHIMLDVISCPHVDAGFRKAILKDFRKSNGLRALNSAEAEKELTFMSQNPWFVDWNRLDLLNLIEKKELRVGSYS